MKTHRPAQTLGPPQAALAAACEVHAVDTKARVDFHDTGQHVVQNE